MTEAKRVKNNDPFLTVKEAAEYCHVSVSIIYDRIYRRDLEVQRIGRFHRIRMSSIEAWLNWENSKHNNQTG